MVERYRFPSGAASLPSKHPLRWQDRMVMPFSSLRRGRTGPPAADEVIDLSEQTTSGEQADDAVDPVADATSDVDASTREHDPPEPDLGGGGESAPEAQDDKGDGEPVDPGSDGGRASERDSDPADLPHEGRSTAGDRRALRAERRSRRFSALVGALTLRPGMGRGLSPALVVAEAWLWLTGWVLLLSLALTMASGFIAGGPLVRLDAFIDSWRLMHLMPVASISGPISLVPMVPAMTVFALVVHGSGWVWSHLQARQPGWVVPAAGVGAMAGGYLLVALLIATSPTTDAVDDPFTEGWPALIAVLLAGVGVTFARCVLRVAYPRTWLLFRAAGTVVALLLAVSSVVLMVLLLSNWSQMWDMSTSLLSSGIQPPSRFDAAALGAIQLAYLPNMVIWTASYLVGAGFSVGADTVVSPFSVTLGTLPELPITTLLPTEPMRWPWLLLVLVAATSLLAGSVIRNAGLAGRMRTRLVVGLAVAALASMGMGLLAAASNGGLGPGRLSQLGPQAGITMLATLMVVGFGQVTWALFPTLMADIGPFADHARHTVDGLRRKRSARRGRKPAGAAASRRRRPAIRGGRRPRGAAQRSRHEAAEPSGGPEWQRQAQGAAAP